MEAEKAVLAYFGHHKCGSKMIMRIIERASCYMGLKYGNFHSPKVWDYDTNHKTLDKVVADINLDFVSYNNADKKYIGIDKKFLGIHVIRDPRDIIVSSYFSHRYSHSTDQWPELADFREVLERLHQNDGLLESMKFTANLKIDGWDINLFDSLMNWNYSLPNIMEIKFERLVNNPYQTFIDMFDFLSILDSRDPTNLAFLCSLFRYKFNNLFSSAITLRKTSQIPAWILLSFVYANRFSKLAGGRNIGREDMKSHYRKGTPGDWKNYFNEQHKDYFKKNHNDLLIKLGYEKDDEW
jgi:hypothetical protein